ncbi:VOC family protein [Patescibacteria group bacterium]|nr:VOC family protein [Patescibacteria group bacterium]
MYKNLNEFFLAAQKELDLFNAWVAKTQPAARADHICYKCGSQEEYEELRAFFDYHSDFVYQSIISARRIAIVKFTTPIATELGDIWYLELSDQKPDGSQVSGFDHIEIYPLTGSLDDFALQLEGQGVALEKTVRPHHTTYDTLLSDSFKVRLEPDALVDKIKREEM